MLTNNLNERGIKPLSLQSHDGILHIEGILSINYS